MSEYLRADFLFAPSVLQRVNRVVLFFLGLDTEVTSWGGVIVTPGPKAYEKQQDQEDEEVEGEGDDEPEDSSEMPSQEQTEEKMETNQET